MPTRIYPHLSQNAMAGLDPAISLRGFYTVG